MNLYIFLAGIGLAIALVAAGFEAGRKVERLDAVQERATELDHVVTQQQVVIKEVPKIVTKVVTREVTVEKEVQRVVTVSSHMLDPDCVLPGDFGMLLVAAANGVDPTGDIDEIAGKYGCREVLAAILSDLQSGWINSARLEGLQQYEKTLIATQGNDAPKGGSP